jgi:hypothetical protein
VKSLLVLSAVAAIAWHMWLLLRVSSYRVDLAPPRSYLAWPAPVWSLHQLFRADLYLPEGRALLPWLRVSLWTMAITFPFGFGALVGLLGW